ncbi:MAG: tetratricopeptide repeat protein [Cytophagales bacterium]
MFASISSFYTFFCTFFIVLVFSNFSFGNNQSVADTLISKADKYIATENYLEALDYYLKATSVLETRIHDSLSLAYSYKKIGLCYDYFDYVAYSKSYFNKALQIYASLGDKKGQAYCYAYLGDMLEDAAQNNEALETHKRALKLFLDLGDAAGEAMQYDNMASVYENYNKLDTSFMLLRKALVIYSRLQDSIGICVSLNNYGDIYYKLKKYPISLSYFKRSLAIAQKIGNKEEERGNLRDISRVYEALGDYKNSYLYFAEYFSLHKKLKIEKKIEEIAGIEARSIQEKKNLEIKSLEAEREIIRLQSTIITICLISFFLILLSVYIAFLVKSKKDKQLDKLQKANMESELVMKREKLLDFARMLAERGVIIDDLKHKLEHDQGNSKDKNPDAIRYRALEQLSNASILTDEDWKKFKKQFEAVHEGFFSKIKDKYPDFSTGDIRLAAILKLKLSQDEIAHMMGISPDSVKKAKSRLKKKISIDDDFKIKEWIDDL